MEPAGHRGDFLSRTRGDRVPSASGSPEVPVVPHQQQPWHRHPSTPLGISVFSAGAMGAPRSPASPAPKKGDMAPLHGVLLPRTAWALLTP